MRFVTLPAKITHPQWNARTLFLPGAVPNTATYGQTVTPTSGQAVLSSLILEVQQQFGTAPQYQAFVYQWGSVDNRITGSSLFTSGVFTAPTTGAAFAPVTINTGSTPPPPSVANPAWRRARLSSRGRWS